MDFSENHGVQSVREHHNGTIQQASKADLDDRVQGAKQLSGLGNGCTDLAVQSTSAVIVKSEQCALLLYVWAQLTEELVFLTSQESVIRTLEAYHWAADVSNVIIAKFL